MPTPTDTFAKLTSHTTKAERLITLFKELVANALEQQTSFMLLISFDDVDKEYTFGVVPTELGTTDDEVVIAIVDHNTCVLVSELTTGHLHAIYNELKELHESN